MYKLILLTLILFMMVSCGLVGEPEDPDNPMGLWVEGIEGIDSNAFYAPGPAGPGTVRLYRDGDTTKTIDEYGVIEDVSIDFSYHTGYIDTSTERFDTYGTWDASEHNTLEFDLIAAGVEQYEIKAYSDGENWRIEIDGEPYSGGHLFPVWGGLTTTWCPECRSVSTSTSPWYPLTCAICEVVDRKVVEVRRCKVFAQLKEEPCEN